MASATKVVGGGALGGLAAVAAFMALTPSCPSQAACLCWTPPTTYTNGLPIAPTQVITYRFWRNNVALPQNVQRAGPEQMCHNLLNEPTGLNTYQVTAVIGNESDKSNSASKFVRAAAPTEGAIEAPTDGGIEDL